MFVIIIVLSFLTAITRAADENTTITAPPPTPDPTTLPPATNATTIPTTTTTTTTTTTMPPTLTLPISCGDFSCADCLANLACQLCVDGSCHSVDDQCSIRLKNCANTAPMNVTSATRFDTSNAVSTMALPSDAASIDFGDIAAQNTSSMSLRTVMLAQLATCEITVVASMNQTNIISTSIVNRFVTLSCFSYL